jgi:hypothetical protein
LGRDPSRLRRPATLRGDWPGRISSMRGPKSRGQFWKKSLLACLAILFGLNLTLRRPDSGQPESTTQSGTLPRRRAGRPVRARGAPLSVQDKQVCRQGRRGADGKVAASRIVQGRASSLCRPSWPHVPTNPAIDRLQFSPVPNARSPSACIDPTGSRSCRAHGLRR